MPAHRLLLSVDELAALCAAHAVHLPSPFRRESVGGRVGKNIEEALAVARAHVETRGLLKGAAGAAVAHNLELLSAPRLAIRVDIVIDDEAVSMLIAVGDGAGATIAHAHRSAVELSLWPVDELPGELGRLIPHQEPRSSGRPIIVDARALIGAVGVADDRGMDAAEMLLTSSGVEPGDADQLLRLAASSRGSLHAIVTGGMTDGTGGVGLGHVVWLLTRDGWRGMRGLPDGLVAWEPVAVTDLGAWLAPYVAELVA